MKAAIATLALLAAPAFAVGTQVSTQVGGTGAVILGAANQTLGDKTVTLVVGNTTAPSLTAIKDGSAQPGVNAGTASFGLTVGSVLGGGVGGAGGTAGTQATGANTPAP